MNCIFMCVDKLFLEPFKVSLHSFINHCNADLSNVHLEIFTSNLNPIECDDVVEYREHFKELHFTVLDTSIYNNISLDVCAFKTDKVQITMYPMRLGAIDILKDKGYHHGLYMDSDILVINEVSYMLEFNDDVLIEAALDDFHHKELIERYKGISSHYFNNGIFKINFNLLDKNYKLSENYVSYTNLSVLEQDYMNMIFADDTYKSMPRRYNAFGINKWASNTSLIHYVLVKPWKTDLKITHDADRSCLFYIDTVIMIYGDFLSDEFKDTLISNREFYLARCEEFENENRE